jgi:hypothetical protein
MGGEGVPVKSPDVETSTGGSSYIGMVVEYHARVVVF